jgi:hypothetical protein
VPLLPTTALRAEGTAVPETAEKSARHSRRPAQPRRTPLQPLASHSRRRVLAVQGVTRPLHVAQVTYRASRFAFVRPALLVVAATGVFVLDQTQGELEAADGGHATIQLAVRASEVRRWRGGRGC